MGHKSILDRRRAGLVVIDIQEKFRPVMEAFNPTALQIATFVEGCSLLKIPILVTEQYPKGLGKTAAEVTVRIPEESIVLEKTCFSSCGLPEFDFQLRERHIEQVMLVGIEAHICVSQTAHDLLALGYQVHIISDAVASRFAHNREIALRKMEQSGAVISSVEMALFELMKTAEAPEFRAIQKLIS